MEEEIEEYVRLDTIVQLALMSISNRETNFKDMILDVEYTEPSIIKCIKSEVLEALINIFQNCHDFLGGDKRVIFIRTYRIILEENSGIEWIILEVMDNGPGIEDYLINSIFELGVSTKAGSGYGFGLHIAQQLIESNGGKIRIESPASSKRCPKILGRGTLVKISFPVI